MNKILKTSTAGLIVAVGLSTGHTTAQTQNNNSEISQATCEERLSHSKRPERDTQSQHSNVVLDASKELSLDGWSDEAIELLGALNNGDFDEGTLSIVDCVGSSNTARVRTQGFELENFYRQGNESRGWRLTSEATKLDEPSLRLVRLELPPNYLWQVNTTGDGLIAKRELVYARSTNAERFPRIRTTEVATRGDTLLVTQRTTTNGLFDELVTWTLK